MASISGTSLCDSAKVAIDNFFASANTKSGDVTLILFDIGKLDPCQKHDCIKVCDQGNPDPLFDAVKEKLLERKCGYCLFMYTLSAEELEKTAVSAKCYPVFVYWSDDNNAPVKQKMVYASSKGVICNYLGSRCTVHLECNDASEICTDAVFLKIKKAHASI